MSLDPEIWNALPLFEQLVQCGSIKETARSLNMSSATLTRRLNALEDQLHCRLFVRSNEGLTLTTQGEDFYHQAHPLISQSQVLHHWQKDHSQTRSVHITAGHWSAYFLTQHLHSLESQASQYELIIAPNIEQLDIQGREADIAIRSHRPTQDNLVVKQGNTVHFAPYCGALNQQQSGSHPWAQLLTHSQTTPSSLWLNNQNEPVRYKVSDCGALLQLLITGVAKALLPTFIGEKVTGLQRCGAIIDSLSHQQWLVIHQVDRHHPHIRMMFDWLVNTNEQHTTTFQKPQDSD
ncbi:LysR family transcriptional regulator [Marinomonas polaris]|uniref:LysR family transcriptional regulator n=1 Tax=Marinomonas polaris TaxID=293552 RepID=UPI003F9752F0